MKSRKKKKAEENRRCRSGQPGALEVHCHLRRSGGYCDSGYVQPLDFFGAGTRIPLIAVSPYTEAGHISHTYADHVSTIKFIERNWNLPTISNRSRDNLPNPKPGSSDYVPANIPGFGDLFDLFAFK